MFLLPVGEGIMIAHYSGSSSFAVNHDEDYLGLDLDFNQSVEDPYDNRGNTPAGAVVGGRPFITYYDSTNGDLRLAVGRY